MYEYIIPTLKEKSSIIGLCLYFKSFDMISRFKEDKRKLFDGRTIFQSIEGYNYIQTTNYDEGILYEGDNINDFFLKGDKVHTKIIGFDRRDGQ